MAAITSKYCVCPYAAFPGEVIVTNTSLYDVLGQRYTVGLKIKL
jgi:hypothetical protein